MDAKSKTWDLIGKLRDEFSLTAIAELSAPVREAECFAYILANLPMEIIHEELIAGEFGWQSGNLEACGKLHERLKTVSGEQKTIAPDKSVAQILHEQYHCYGAYTSAHTCINYQEIIELGTSGTIEKISIAEKSFPVDRREYFKGMKIALNALENWAERFVTRAEELSYFNIAETCRKVPRYPAESFAEAVQSIWLVHSVIGISEFSDASISLGRLDQYLYPFYLKSLSQGKSEAELEELLTELFLKLNRYGDAACNVNIGGLDNGGRDLLNPLSEMIIRVVKKNQLPSPILATRIHPEIPENVFDLLTVPELFKIGQPSFYGELPCRKAMENRGISEAESSGWAANSCMGLLMPGAEINDMWGSVINLCLPLELTLNQGKPFAGKLPLELKTKALIEFRNIVEIKNKFMEYTGELISFCIEQNRQGIEFTGKNRPNPFLTALLDGGTESGLDRLLGGVKYHTVVVEAFGLINVADSLTVIDELVFKSGEYSLESLVEAVKNNYLDNEALRHKIISVPKFGNGQLSADLSAKEIAEAFAAKVNEYSDEQIKYAPSFHTLNTHVNAGEKTSASLDGRHKGTPLSKNIGPIPGRSIKGHTSLIKSASVIDQENFFGGQALDISIDTALLKTMDGKKSIQSLLQTYFKLGGLQIQVNGLDPELMRKALENPEAHRDLIVRIAGYSDYFNKLSGPVKQEMITRMANGL